MARAYPYPHSLSSFNRYYTKIFSINVIHWLTRQLAQDPALAGHFDITQEPNTHESWKTALEGVRQKAIETLESTDFNRQAFFAKFQESFVRTSDHGDD